MCKPQKPAGVRVVLLAYIADPIKPADWTIQQAMSDLERLCYLVSLVGVKFDKDNGSV